MRAFISKVVAGSMIASAALMISACKPAATTDTNVADTNMTTTNVSEDMTMTENSGMAADTNMVAGNEAAPVENKM